MLCFFFNAAATTEIYTLSLHDALPISRGRQKSGAADLHLGPRGRVRRRARASRNHHRQNAHRCRAGAEDRKSTRLNSSHSQISYAVFCLKKKKKNKNKQINTDTRQENQ